MIVRKNMAELEKMRCSGLLVWKILDELRKMVGEGVYGNGDRSLGVHNPFLAEALMRANIQELQSVYALPAPPAPVKQILESPMPGAGPQAAGVRQLLSAR